MVRPHLSGRLAVAPAAAVTAQQAAALHTDSRPSGTDHTTRASIVRVDPQALCVERDRAARALLTESLPAQRVLHVVSGVRMTVPYELKAVISEADVARLHAAALHVIDTVFSDVDLHLNCHNPASEISAINAGPAGHVAQVSASLAAVLTCAHEVFDETGGAFDIATAPMQRFLLGVADPERLSAEEQHISDRLAPASSWLLAWHFDASSAELTKLHADAALDLGGVAKGYAVDCVHDGLIAAGLEDFIFDWGGDCRASGRSPGGAPWAVGIARPPALQALGDGSPASEPSMLVRVLSLDGEAVATSGDYEHLHRAEASGRLFTRTVDPRSRTLVVPRAVGVAQVSVRCRSCMYADALATACLVKGDIQRSRFTLELWRHRRHAVSDYVAYQREGELAAHMHELATEDADLRQRRIDGSIPGRVIVVGGGLAGLSAAVAAAAAGSTVVVVDKAKGLGGNSAKATSGINGWGTAVQEERDIRDGGRYFERDTHRSGAGGTCAAGLVRLLSAKSGEAVTWLSKTLDVPLTVISQLGGHSRPRTHRAPDQADGTPVPIGYTIMKHMEAHIRKNLGRSVTIMTNTSVVALTTSAGPDGTRITGATLQGDAGEAVSLAADAVVLATGGFSNDHTADSLLDEFAPHLAATPTTNGAFATGDGVKMARKVGARLVDMDKVQLHPTGFIDPKQPANPTKFLGPEALRGSGGILVNSRGQRFVNELDLRSVVSQAIIKQGDVYEGSGGACFAWCILNDVAAKLFGPGAFGFYKNKVGLFQEAADVAALAALIGCPEEALRATLESYGACAAAASVCPATHKSVFPCVIGATGPFYAACVTPAIHYTMGGVVINASAEVCAAAPWHGLAPRPDPAPPIYGLFGAGEVTGGVHGRNRLGGNSLLECVVFGRIAGDRAATILQRRSTALCTEAWTPVVLSEVVDDGEYGAGSRMLRFSLPGSMQCSGLRLGQYVELRGEWDGAGVHGYFSPISLPDRRGSLDLLCRVDRGPHREWLAALQPGCAVEMRAGGGLSVTEAGGTLRCGPRDVRRVAMIAGGSGIAPMLQIIKALLRPAHHLDSLTLLYAAETAVELSCKHLLEAAAASCPLLQVSFVLNDPPAGWTGEVGFVDRDVIRRLLPPPSSDLLIVLCGPPVMQRSVAAHLLQLGYDLEMVQTADQRGDS